MIIKSGLVNRETIIDPMFPSLDERSKTPKPMKLTNRFIKSTCIKKFNSSFDIYNPDNYNQKTQHMSHYSIEIKKSKTNTKKDGKILKNFEVMFQGENLRYKSENINRFKPYKSRSYSKKKNNQYQLTHQFPITSRVQKINDSYQNLLKFHQSVQPSARLNVQSIKNKKVTNSQDVYQRLPLKNSKRRPLLFNLFKNKIKAVTKNMQNIIN